LSREGYIKIYKIIYSISYYDYAAFVLSIEISKCIMVVKILARSTNYSAMRNYIAISLVY